MRILRPRLFRLATALLSLVGYLSAPAQVNHTTSVTLANVLVNGASVPYGRLCAIAGDSYGNPVTFSSSGWGVVSAGNPFCANVVNGAVSGGLAVPDANQTNRPAPLTYTFSLQLTNSSFVGQSAAIVLFTSVPGVSGPTFSLDGYTPAASAIAPAASNLLGTGSGVPTSCTSPSIWIVPGTTPTLLVCNNGTYQAGSTVAPTINFGTSAGTVAQGNDSRIVAAFKNQGAFSTTQSYNANDVVSVGGSLYYAPTAIATSTTMPPGNGWLALGGATSSGGTVSIDGVSCAVGSTCALTPATLGLAVAAASASPMAGLDYWIPFSQGTPVDVTGNGHSGTIAGSGTAATYVLGGIQPNGQTVSIPNASGRPSFGFCASFPGGDGPLNYGYFYSTTVGSQLGYNISTVYGGSSGHGANAYWPQMGSSAGTAASQSLNGFSGNHCVEAIPGASGQNIVVDGKEVSYALQATGAASSVGGAQLTAPMTVAGGNGIHNGLPITVYSVWGTPSASVDTVAQASARTAFEVSRLQALGVPFGLGSNVDPAATDSTCAFDGTSIDQGFESSNNPISGQLTLSFPCTLHDYSLSGQPASDMDAAFQDRAGSVYHPRAQKNIAFNAGVTNDLTTYLQTPAQALASLLSWNRKAHALGYKTIVSLALSRGGSTGGNTNDSLMQAANQLVLANADEFDWVANPAAWPQLGATGAYANTTYFNADNGSPTHPTVAGDVFYIATEQTAFNGVYPSAPRTITASATQLPADRTVIANCASACTYSLIDANTGNFNSRGKVTVQNIGAATVTLAAVAGETAGSANTLAIAPGASVTILPYEANFTTAGAVWAIQSGLSTPVSTATATSPGIVQLAAGQSATQLAKVASTGAYADLSGTPSLGTAATKNMVGTGPGGPATTPATPIGAGHAVVGAPDGSGGLVDSNITPAQLGTPGQIAAMKPDASSYAPYNVSGDCTASTVVPGALTCTKTNGVSFGTAATTDSNSYDPAGAATYAAAESDPAGTARTLVENDQYSSSAIVANAMVSADPANVDKFATAALGKCGSPAGTATINAGYLFQVLDPMKTWTLIPDGAVTYNHFLIPSTTTPGHVMDASVLSGVTPTDRTTISMEQEICGKALQTVAAGATTVLTEPLGRGTRGLKVDTINGSPLAQSAGQQAVSSLALAGRFDTTHATLVDVFPFNEADGATTFTGIYGNTCVIANVGSSTTPPTYANHALTFGSTTVGGLFCSGITSYPLVQVITSYVPVTAGAIFYGSGSVATNSFFVNTNLLLGSGTTPQFVNFYNGGTLTSNLINANGIHALTGSLGSTVGGLGVQFYVDTQQTTTANGQQSLNNVTVPTTSPLTVGYSLATAGCASGGCTSHTLTVYGFAVYSTQPSSLANQQTLVNVNQQAWSSVLASHGYALGSYVNNNSSDVVEIACGMTSIEAGLNSGTPGCDPSVTGLSSTTYTSHTVALSGQTSAAMLANQLSNYFAYSVPTAQARVAYIGDACTNDMAQAANYANATPAQCYQYLLREVSILKNPPQLLFPGAKPFDKVVVGTMISRTGTGNAANSGINNDTLKNTWNALVRAGASQGGYVLSDEAANPSIGADGANSGTIGTIEACPGATTYFGSDCIHPTIAGQTVKGSIFGRVVTSLFGATEAAPSTSTSNAYAMSVADNFLERTPTAAASDTLPECLGLTGYKYQIANKSSFAITESGFSGGETISGSATVAANSVAIYRVELISAAAGGCTWLRVQ